MLTSEKQVVFHRNQIETMLKDEMKEAIKKLSPQYSPAHELVQTAIFSAVKQQPLKVHYYHRQYETRSIYCYDVALMKAQKNNTGDSSFLQVRIEQHQPLSRNFKPVRDMGTMRDLQQLMLRLDVELPAKMHAPIKSAIGVSAAQFGALQYKLSCVTEDDISVVQLSCDRTRQSVEFNVYH